LAVKKIKAETIKKCFAKAERVKTLLQYLISAKEKNFLAIQRTLFRVLTI
jgi:hypothetical protein